MQQVDLIFGRCLLVDVDSSTADVRKDEPVVIAGHLAPDVWHRSPSSHIEVPQLDDIGLEHWGFEEADCNGIRDAMCRTESVLGRGKHLDDVRKDSHIEVVGDPVEGRSI